MERLLEVSIHAPARGATAAPVRPHHAGRFNPRAREGRDSGKRSRPTMLSKFQSTRPRGARLPGLKPLKRFWKFQSTRPRGARPHYHPRDRSDGMGFNPRAREGRDEGFLGKAQQLAVSIHAPARGATERDRKAAWMEKFQSTRPRGARLVKTSFGEVSGVFQSTRPRGARRGRGE